MKRAAVLLTTCLFLLLFPPGWASLIHVMKWAVLIVAATTLTTVTAFFVQAWLKRTFPDAG